MIYLAFTEGDHMGQTIVNLIIGKILDYLADNADEIVTAIKEKFHIVETDPELRGAVQELGFSPTEENLHSVAKLLEEKGEDPAKLAALLVTKTVVQDAASPTLQA